jgi:hypothetical protein
MGIPNLGKPGIFYREIQRGFGKTESNVSLIDRVAAAYERTHPLLALLTDDGVSSGV